MSPKLTLYGAEYSPPVRAVKLTMKALNLDYVFQEVNPSSGDTRTPEYLQKNPQHSIPTLEDGGKYMWDSHAVMAYLVRKYGKDDTLYPKDFYQRAVVDQRLHYENGAIFTTCMCNTVGPALRGDLTKEKLAELVKGIHEIYDLLEKFLGEHKYMVGDVMTIADFSIVSTISSLQFLAPIEQSKHAKLAGWFERMQQLPYYAEANAKGAKLVGDGIKPRLERLQ